MIGTLADEGAAAAVSVVITTFNQARFLDDALRSVAAQSVRPAQVIVVDDGSHDDPATIVAGFPAVRLIVQPRRGPNAARNAGLTDSSGRYVLFLDADDVLERHAIESGLRCFAGNPGCGFVYGGHRRVDAALRPLGGPLYVPAPAETREGLLRGNFIGMHGAVLYDRARLQEAGGFDEELWQCEEYELYLRMVARHPIASHPDIVALYRTHSEGASNDHVAMLAGALEVLERHRPQERDRAAFAAYKSGRRNWRRHYALSAWNAGGHRRRAMMTRHPFTTLAGAAWAGARRFLPRGVRERLKRLAGHVGPPVGAVDLGDLARARPVSPHFGYDRGTPIDRWYVERFLERNAADIRGRVLEVGSDDYCRRFGTAARQDVLHVSGDNPQATIVGDLSQPGLLPQAAFDCLLITQTLHLVYDMEAAVAQLRQSLAPGGVLLLTVPGVSSVDRGEWGASWYWALTEHSARRLFEPAFGSGNVAVSAHGNVYAATCFLHGLALEETDQSLLARDDPAYPLVVCVHATRK